MQTRITDRSQEVWKDWNAFDVIARKLGCREESEHDILALRTSVGGQSPEQRKSETHTIYCTKR